MRQIVYFSTASAPQLTETVSDILSVSRLNNRIHGVSGLLIAGGNRYFQVIEGKSGPIDDLIRNIRADSRHIGVTLMIDQPITRRNFRGWTMARFTEPRLGELASVHELVHQLTRHTASPRLIGQLQRFADELEVDPHFLPIDAWRDRD